MTPRILLGEITHADAGALLEWEGTDEYLRYLPFEKQTAETMVPRIQRFIDAQNATPRVTCYQPVREDGHPKVVGAAILRLTDVENRVAEIGWAVHPAFQGRGFGTEIARTLLGKAFVELGMHRVWARCDPGNEPSKRIMARVGMLFEGVTREDTWGRGRWWSSYVASILETEWSPRPGETKR